MPLKSEKQRRLMYAAAEGGVKDIAPAVAKKYIAETPSSAYGKLPERTRKLAMKRKSPSTY